MKSCKRQKRTKQDSTSGRKKEVQGNWRQRGIGEVDRESEIRDNRISIAAWEIKLKMNTHGKA